jgi:hypothetical protein
VTVDTSCAANARTHDFNGDGMSDIVWRDGSGNTALWLMSGAAISSAGVYGGLPSTWSIVGQRDFNSDGMSDLLCGMTRPVSERGCVLCFMMLGDSFVLTGTEMAKKITRSRPWTKEEVRMMKTLTREKTRMVFARKLKRSIDVMYGLASKLGMMPGEVEGGKRRGEQT